MHAHSLCRGAVGRVSDDLDQRRRFIAERLTEDGAIRTKSNGPLSQQLSPYFCQCDVPAFERLSEFGNRCRPLVGPLQPHVVVTMCRRTGGALRPDVDLLAPVRESTGQLSAEPGEATKVRTSHHRDGLLVGLRECEQLAGS
ncbi:Uncharacterised protein [Mycobacteroides abscessus subsp. abscessus]|nr:Uncharacterised protein [Mycobacteroides abscessus subsp. abscessus]